MDNITLTEDTEFDIKRFGILMSKLRTFGFHKDIINSANFKNVFSVTKSEIEKDSSTAALAFSVIYSQDFLLSIDKEVLEKLYIALSHYIEIFINLHQYKRFDLVQKKRISETYFKDIVSYNIDNNVKDYILTFKSWLNDLVNQILETF